MMCPSNDRCSFVDLEQPDNYNSINLDASSDIGDNDISDCQILLMHLVGRATHSTKKMVHA